MLYFLKKKPVGGMYSIGELEYVGLGHWQNPGEQCEVRIGPGGGDGVLIAQGGDACRFDPQGQEWRQSTAGDFWFGWVKDHAYDSWHFLKKIRPGGRLVNFEDGTRWAIPAANPKFNNYSLQRFFKLSDDGEFHRAPLEDDLGLCNLAATFFQVFHAIAVESGEAENIGQQQLREAFLISLALNYSIRLEELEAFGWFTSLNVNETLAEFSGWRFFERLIAGEDDAIRLNYDSTVEMMTSQRDALWRAKCANDERIRSGSLRGGGCLPGTGRPIHVGENR